MTIRNILVVMTGSDEDQGAAATAFLAAGQFSAHVAGLHVRPKFTDNVPDISEGMSQTTIMHVIETTMQRIEAAERSAAERFASALEGSGASRADAPAKGVGVTASWQVEEGRVQELAVQRARVFDLTVVSSQGQAIGTSGRNVVDRAVFETGRPVLVPPSQAPTTLGERIFIGWNRSAQSARAVASAMPFLERASHVVIAYVDTGAKAGPGPEELRASLAWHDVDAEVKRIPPGGASVAELIGVVSADFGADLLVMGAYSHSRLREMILGGVTNSILDHTPLPVLMMH